MPTLLETQTAVGRDMVSGVAEGIAALMVPSDFTANEVLSVYRSTYLGALVRALRLSFPAVQRLVGEEFFEGAARIFIDGNPPRSACLNDYGAGFADFLAAFEPAAGLPYLADVARLEWAVRAALHGEKQEGLSLEALAGVAGDVRFTAQPGLSLLSSDYPVDLIWRSVLDRDDAALGTLDLASAAIHLLIEPTDTGVEVRRCSEADWQFLKALCEGTSLLGTLEPLGEQAGSFLGAHIAAGRFVAFHPVETLS